MALFGHFYYFQRMKTIPVYSIRDFRKFSQQDAFYASPLKNHIRNHDFTNFPHKHDFFMVVLFTSGKGIHEVDFIKYTVHTGSLFVLRPGQMHNWKLSADCNGYIFFHTRNFYDEGFTHERVSDYPFYATGQGSPLFHLKGLSYSFISSYFRTVTDEYISDRAFKFQKLHALVNLIYIELLRLYHSDENNNSENYLSKLRQFEELIEKHYHQHLSASAYAKMMNLSEKHLNRICKLSIGKTSTDLIAERLVLEAKRLLIASKLNITQIAEKMGFADNSYFTRFFKKRTGKTPSEFLNNYTK